MPKYKPTPKCRPTRSMVLVAKALQGKRFLCARRLIFHSPRKTNTMHEGSNKDYDKEEEQNKKRVEALVEEWLSDNETANINNNTNDNVDHSDIELETSNTKEHITLSKDEIYNNQFIEPTYSDNQGTENVPSNAVDIHKIPISAGKKINIMDVTIVKPPDLFVQEDVDQGEIIIEDLSKQVIQTENLQNLLMLTDMNGSDISDKIDNEIFPAKVLVQADVHDIPPSMKIDANTGIVQTEILDRSEEHTNVIHDKIDQAVQIQCFEDEIEVISSNQDIQDATVSSLPKIRGKRALLKKQSYLDFISDDEVPDYEWDSSSWKSSDTNCTSDSTEQKKITKKKNKKRRKTIGDEDEKVGTRGFIKEKKISEKKKRKESKNKGEEYKTVSGRVVEAKALKPNPCIGAKRCNYKCYDISEDKRKSVFDYFNALSLQRKRDWLAAMCVKEIPKKKRKKETARRDNSFLYFINDGEGRRQVCLRFILNTLDVTQKFVHYTLSNSEYNIAKEEQRGKSIPKNKTKKEAIDSVKQFITKLPAVPSHYCRKDSTRVYLPSKMKNVANLYLIYKKEQIEGDLEYVSEKIFRQVFSNDFNIGFHVPKKDKCAKCVSYNDKLINNVVLDEQSLKEKETHDLEKQASDDRFKFHKSIRDVDKSTLCISFDMQKVLNTPMGDNMLLFYSRKYAMYNLTFYESVTRRGYCYTWGETDGKRGANEVATIIHKYIKELDQRNEAQNILFYCDSCPGQNKNKTVIATLHFALQECVNIQTIQINFLLPGHTLMPVDSMHAVIEKSINGTIWAPSQWPTIFQLARKSYGPYDVTVLEHKDFLGYDKYTDKYFKGNLSGKISKITSATMKKGKKYIQVKYSMQVDAPTESIDVAGNTSSKHQPPCIYKNRLPLPDKKLQDLIQLCEKGIIPSRFHAEYRQMESKNNVTETLIETDEEDE